MTRSPSSTERVWSGAAGVALLLLGGLGCEASEEARLYRIERDLWKATRMEQTLRIAGPGVDAASVERVLRAYDDVLARNPATSASTPGDSTLMLGIVRHRVEAHIGLARVHRVLGDGDAALGSLDRAYRDYLWDPLAAARLFGAFIQELLQAGDADRAIEIYREATRDLPARTSDGRALPFALEAPLRAADLLFDLGRREDALAELGVAAQAYRAVLEENEADEAAAFCWLQLGEIAARQGEFREAEISLQRARSLPAAERLRPRILLTLGRLEQEQGRLEQAQATFAELVGTFPRDPLAPEALLLRSTSLADLGRAAEALAALNKIRTEFATDQANGARAEILAARILARANRWSEALTHYRKLESDFPASPLALGAPFEIADHYRQAGEREAEIRTLQRGIETYQRVREAYAGTAAARIADEMSARAYARLEQWDEALGALVGLAERHPSDPRAPLFLIEAAAVALERLNDPLRAADLLERLVSSYPESPLAVRAREEAERLRQP